MCIYFIPFHANRFLSMLHIRPLSHGGIHSIADDSSLQTAKHSVSQKFLLDFRCEASPTPVIHPESVSQNFPAEIWQVSFTHTCNPARKLYESFKKRKQWEINVSYTTAEEQAACFSCSKR